VERFPVTVLSRLPYNGARMKWARVRKALIEPVDALERPEQRNRMRWLSIGLLVLSPMAAVGASVEPGQLGRVLAVLLALLVVAYGLSRTRHYHLAVATTLAGFIFQAFSSPFVTGSISTREQALFAYIWLLIPFAVSAMFLSARAVLAIAGLLASFLVGHAVLVEQLAFPIFGSSLAMLLVVFVIITSSVRIRAKDVERIEQQARELNRARVAAEAASRAKGAFLANMSHELRTPMNAVQGMISLLLDSDVPSEHGESMKVVQQSGDALMSLLNDILDYSKLDADHLELEPGAFSLRECIEDAMRTARPQTSTKGVELRLQWDDSTPELVCADQARVRQVLDNLLDNAAKYTRHGHISVRTHARPIAAKGAGPSTCEDSDPATAYELCIEIEDTGRGIVSADRQRVFEAFSQGDASITRKQGGTGLGLAICRRLVELMGGRLELQSTTDEGSTFTVSVPVTGVSASATERLVAEPQALEESRHSEGSMSILLVEDNLLNQRVALSMLRRLGHDADLAEDGRRALDAVSKQRYDVVLMDVQMPVMDGLEATRHIRETVEVKQQPYIIAVTAHTLQGDREDCLDAGMDEYLGKPFRLADLERVLQASRAA